MKLITIVLALSMTFVVSAQTRKDKKIIKDAAKAKKELVKTDTDINGFFENSAGYVIFPNVGEGGFLVGAASGNGVLYQEGTAQGMANLKKLDVGFQAGGQSVIEVIFFESEDDVMEFEEDNFEFSAQISAVALKSGVAANAKYKDGVAVFTLPKSGLMAKATVGGQKFKYSSF
ncbi:lipid-binding SYLF domain-containing protein [Zobellia laminariae]|uniref:lipid-binding SYLF domain-containing protein n=1 Tax=Zobellia laminariae TaxID=248906 RepID=UPI0026F40F6D|nr:lipid-binding SYLF domain-containing protein [Zobellia laminariae]WKX75201.1 lipid-binding SYLF domain-containing protein [Zobellia laminariae]